MNTSHISLSTILLLFILTFAASPPVAAQKLINIRDSRNTIWLNPGKRIAYLTHWDTIRVAGIRPLKKNETTRLGIIFKTGLITSFDSTAIQCGETRIPYASIDYIFMKKSYLEFKIPGILVMLASAGLVFSTINTSHSEPANIENKKILFGIGGIFLGAFFTFHNYNPVVKKNKEALYINVVL